MVDLPYQLVGLRGDDRRAVYRSLVTSVVLAFPALPEPGEGVWRAGLEAYVVGLLGSRAGDVLEFL
jgi:hypothetical protein